VIDERNYRLSNCGGFAAFDPGGRIGVVTDLHYGSRSDRPDFLVIRRGLVRRRRISIPVEQVVEIDMAGRKVVVHGAGVGRIRWSHPAEEMEGVVQERPSQTSSVMRSFGSSASSAGICLDAWRVRIDARRRSSRSTGLRDASREKAGSTGR